MTGYYCSRVISCVAMLLLALAFILFSAPVLAGGGGGGDPTPPTPPNLNGIPAVDGGPDEENNPKDGDPISMSKGNYTTLRVDLTVPGPIPIRFSRTYDSMRVSNNAVGWKWDHSLNTRMYEVWQQSTPAGGDGQSAEAQGVVRPTAQAPRWSAGGGGGTSYDVAYYRAISSTPPSGATLEAVIVSLARVGGTSQWRFIRNTNGTYTAPAGCFFTLEDSSGGERVLTSPGGTTWTFSDEGLLLRQEDRNGNELLYTYTTNGRVYRVSNGGGRHITLIYKNNGLLSRVQDHNNRIVRFIHDASGDLIRVISPAVPGFPNGTKVEYDYDANHNITHVRNQKGEVYLQNNWDVTGNFVTSQVYAGATNTINYNHAPNTTRYTDWRGYHTDYEYDADGNLVKKTVHTAGLRGTDPATYVTQYEYDADFQVTRVIHPRGNSTVYKYNGQGRTIEIREKLIGAPIADDPVNDLVWTYSYDPVYSQLTSFTDPESKTTNVIRDANGNAQQVDTPIVPNTVMTYLSGHPGWVETVTDPNGVVTKYEYHTAINDRRFGFVKAITFDYGTAVGDLNARYEFGYDLYGNLATLTDPLSNVVTYEYNELRNVQKITGPAPFNYETKITYDANLRPVLIELQADDVGTTWQTYAYTYDQRGNVLTINEQGGLAVTTFTYDNGGHVSTVLDAENKLTSFDHDERGMLWKTTSALGHVTTYDYDPNYNLARLLDANNVPTLYSYDNYDRPDRVTYDDTSYEEYTFDKVGNLKTLRTRANDLFTFQYDDLHRRTQKITPEQTYTYTYDLVSRLDTATNQHGAVDLDYDDMNRLVKETDVHGRVLEFEHDLNGRRTTLHYPDGNHIDYEYDNLDRLIRIKDASGAAIIDYGYDSLSRYKTLDHANGTSTDFTFDLINRLNQISHNLGSANLDWDYTTNLVGIRTAIDAPEGRYDFDYDDDWRLTEVDYPAPGSGAGKKVTYNLDGVGNRTSVTDDGVTTTYVKNTLNQYPTVGGTARSHDLNGNVISDGVRTMVHDSENRLQSVTVAGGAVVSYDYDAFGRRVTRWLNGLTPRRYTYDGWDVIHETHNNDTETVQYVTGLMIDEPLQRINDDGAIYTYHGDAIGSITAVTDDNGDVVERYTYDVYGEVSITNGGGAPLATSGIGNEYFFTARRLDPTTGFYNYRARDYDPETGRFLQPDPWKYVDGPNMYSHVGNDPINYIDPSGRVLWKKPLIAFKGGLAIGKKYAAPLAAAATKKIIDAVKKDGKKKDTNDNDNDNDKNDNEDDGKDKPDFPDEGDSGDHSYDEGGDGGDGGDGSGGEGGGDSPGRSISEQMDDFNNNPDNWDLDSSETEPSTNVRNKGGQSTRETFTNRETGETLQRHTMTDKNGNVVHQHLKPID